MGKSLPDGDIQFLNSYRISATVSGKEVSFNPAPCTSLATEFLPASFRVLWGPRINHGENDAAMTKSTRVQEAEGVCVFKS